MYAGYEGEMNQSEFSVLVFTDMDGTLLDDHYDLQGAAYVLNEMYRHGVYTVPASSKTRAELKAFAKTLIYEPPLIVENGASVVWPESLSLPQECVEDTSEDEGAYASICSTLADLRAQYGYEFSGFADMSVDEICSLTGLDSTGALLAQQRMASEPVSWADSPEHLADFRAHLKQQDLMLMQGGRFWHVMQNVDKGIAADKVEKVLSKLWGVKPCVLACGDSANDLAMLERAQGCVLFPQRDGSYLQLANKPCINARAPGTLTWLEAVNQLLSVLDCEFSST